MVLEGGGGGEAGIRVGCGRARTTPSRVVASARWSIQAPISTRRRHEPRRAAAAAASELPPAARREPSAPATAARRKSARGRRRRPRGRRRRTQGRRAACREDPRDEIGLAPNDVLATGSVEVFELCDGERRLGGGGGGGGGGEGGRSALATTRRARPPHPSTVRSDRSPPCVRRARTRAPRPRPGAMPRDTTSCAVRERNGATESIGFY